MERAFQQNKLAPFGTPVRVHDTLCSLNSTCEVCATVGLKSQRGIQQLVRGTRQIVFYRGRRFVIEEDQAIRVPSDSASLGVAIYGSLAGQPEAVKGREDTSEPVICGGRDAFDSSCVMKRLTILLTHRSRSAFKSVSNMREGKMRDNGPVNNEDTTKHRH
jgi:hypothetical protein